MDKRTILAVVLSIVIITVGVGIQSLYSPATPKVSTASPVPSASQNPSPVPSPPSTSNTTTVAALATKPGSLADPNLPSDAIVPIGSVSSESAPYIYDNGTLRVTFDPVGAGVVSLKLVQKKADGKYQYLDGKDPVEMIMPGPESGLLTRFGGADSPLLAVPFIRASSSDKNTITYYREFSVNNTPEKTFRVTKTYTFYPKEFLFQLDIAIDSSTNDAIPLNQNGFAYTVSLGPQIGPVSSHLIQNQDMRRFVYLASGKRETPGIAKDASQKINDRLDLVAIDGKYFTFAIVPGAEDIRTTLEAKYYDGKQGNQVDLSRLSIHESHRVDRYRVYAGPKLSNILAKYNKAEDNSAQQSGLKLDQIPDGGNPIWWLEEALKWIMGLFYRVIPNWGIAIILLTILVKAAVYPLSKKGMISMARMQTLNPKITELRAKHKDNPQKLNAEMAELYKKEKISPLGGCLPMLLQFPFFIAMYNLFNNHFDLRGAMFIPGWIPDLSVADTVIHFSVSIPLFFTTLQLNGLHLLPFLYLATQLLTTKMTQSTQTAGASNGQMKFMMYGLPLMFFFILYEGPAGLFVYWIFQNILSIFQQQYINRHLEKMNLRQKAEKPSGVLPPSKKRKTK